MVHSQAVLGNDLEKIDAAYRPVKISVWSLNQVIQGIRFHYSNTIQNDHDSCTGELSHIWELAKDGSEIIVEVAIREGEHSTGKIISSIAFVTSNCNVFDMALPQVKEKAADGTASADTILPPTDPSTLPTLKRKSMFLRPDGARWSLRGLCGFSRKPTTQLPSGMPLFLAVLWGKDTFLPTPTVALSIPTSKSCLALGKLSASSRQAPSGEYQTGQDTKELLHLGATAAAATELQRPRAADTDPASPFNALDEIDVSWVIKTIRFAFVDGKLAGLRVAYTNGEIVTHGKFEREVWKCDVLSDLVVVKLTVGRTTAQGAGFVDNVEFLCADKSNKKSEPALWPLDISTVRFLGEGSTRVGMDVNTVVEKAPEFGGNAKWTVRGFYGETTGDVISRISIVWGRG